VFDGDGEVASKETVDELREEAERIQPILDELNEAEWTIEKGPTMRMNWDTGEWEEVPDDSE
jgi:hypothetical protein